MVAASAMQLLTFRPTEDAPYFEMIPPLVGVEVSGYQACQNIKKNVTNPPVHFCQLAIPMAQVVVTSVCVPQTCTKMDLDIIFYALIAPTLPPGTLGPGFPAIFACDDDEKEYSDDPKAQSTAGIFTSIASVVALATLVAVTREVIQFLRSGKSEDSESAHLLPNAKVLNNDSLTQAASAPESWVWKLAACWDVRASLDALLFISPERPTNFLNGMRVFSIMWVVLGHCVAFPMMPGLDNMEYVEGQVASNYRWILVESGVYAVDTFFYMSGFLATYLLMKSFPRTITPFQAVPRVLMIYLDRYVRLTPLFGLVILASYNLLQHMCVAPFSIWYTNGGPVAAGCGEKWWRNILYINNVRGTKDMTCLGHSWYLANDMQFMLVGVPMVVFHALTVDHPTLKWVSLSLPVLTLIVSLIVTGATKDSSNAYVYPYIRAAPYFYGILAGIALANKPFSAHIKRVTAAWWVRYVAYSFCGAIMLGCMTLQWQAMRVTLGYHNIHWSKSMQSLHQFVYHCFWGLALSVLSLVWAQGHGGWVTRFLSCPLFEPMGRVTYGVYLIHPMVYAVLKTGVSPTLLHYSDVWLLCFWITCTAGSYLSACIAFVFIERPVGSLWDWASGRKKRRAQRQ
eukprot:TRINITY_DN10906_c0_g1_i1.p1 TRINITY_DN10906_c0_g1~~TRINITY_DN10906_c0_g1_i1.p1  ORF type:complete len:727 (+),score=205.10 TRINITY_DN10906_c0_g1_i1:307-2181(+)